MNPRVARFALAGAILAFATACGPPRIRIERTRPPVFNLSRTQPIAVQAEADGVEPATNVLEAAVGITQGQVLNKYLAVIPVQKEFTEELVRAEYKVAMPGESSLVMKVIPTGWTYEIEDLKDVRMGSGKLEVRIELRDAKDPKAPALYKQSYWGTAQARHLGEPEAMAQAAENIVQRFLEDLQPYRVSDTVELDDADPAVKPGIELCKRGQFDAAYTAFSDIVARNPSSAPALYNLGVLAESRGNYDEAEDALVKASQIVSKAIYYQALERVRVARSDWEVLQQQEQAN